jgi:hypothetical protein
MAGLISLFACVLFNNSGAPGAMPTALRGHGKHALPITLVCVPVLYGLIGSECEFLMVGCASHAHAKPWASHPAFLGNEKKMKFQVFGCGRLFDVDACGVGTGFKFDWIFRRGERHGQRNLDRSGFHLHLGDATKLSLDQQIGIAAQFLTSNREAIVRLRQWPGLEDIKVMLSPEHPMRPDVVGSPIVDIPLELMRICTDLGLGIALGIRYKWIDRPVE